MFVAVQPPDDVLDHLDDFLDARRDAADFRWTLREHLHVTLAFLAEVPDRARDDLEARLERAAKRRTAFAAALAGGWRVPDVARAAVLWTGLDLSDPARTRSRGWRRVRGRRRQGRVRSTARGSRRTSRSPGCGTPRGDARGCGSSTPTAGPRGRWRPSTWSRRSSAKGRATGHATKLSRRSH
jgi:hypothetical protein